MTDTVRDSLERHPWVTIQAASQLTDLDVPTLREWARLGDLNIEQRGDMEVVQLEVVAALASRHRPSSRGSLHDRLRDAENTEPAGEVVNVVDLHESAVEREP